MAGYLKGCGAARLIRHPAHFSIALPTYRTWWSNVGLNIHGGVRNGFVAAFLEFVDEG